MARKSKAFMWVESSSWERVIDHALQLISCKTCRPCSDWVSAYHVAQILPRKHYS